jgi:hypothetical protein
MKMFSIFCGCTSNKNIQDSVITLNVEDNIDEEKKEEEPALVEIEKLIEILEESADSEKTHMLEEVNDSEDVKDISAITEEDQEVIDILSENPPPNPEEITIKRKYFFF